MKIKNWTLCIGVSSLLVAAALGLQGCSSDSISIGSSGAAGESTSEAGAAGKTETAGSGGASAGSAGLGDAGSSSEPLTQAELCEKFCTDEFDICTGDLQQYDTLEDCAAECNQFARGAVGDTSGDTLDCRIYHLGAASGSAAGSATTHCPHTSATPTAFCVDAAK